jgi:hypothetical protein
MGEKVKKDVATGFDTIKTNEITTLKHLLT